VCSLKLKIKVLKPFSDIIGKRELELDFKGITLDDLLQYLVDRYPKLKEEFYKNAHELTDYLCIFVNDKPISALDGTNTGLNNGDELLFFVPVSGG